VDPPQIADDHAGEDYSIPGTSAAIWYRTMMCNGDMTDYTDLRGSG